MFDSEYKTWCEVNEFTDHTMHGLYSLYIDIRAAVLNFYAVLEETQ